MFMAQERSSACRLLWGVLLVSLFILPGCSHEKRVYQPNPADPAVQTLPLKIAVVELEDGSQEEGWKKSELLNEALIPLVPSAPILVKLNDTRFGKCLSAELKASRQFSTVDYHENWEKMAEQFKTYDLVVTGHLRQDRTEATDYFYALSMPGDLFWLLGLPAKSFSRHISIDITAFQTHAPERWLLSHKIKVQDKMFDGFYYGGHTDGSSLLSKVYWLDPQDTDYCPTELLRPEFMALRNSLAAAIKDKVLLQGVSSLQKQ
jgi:hypothetical protein